MAIFFVGQCYFYLALNREHADSRTNWSGMTCVRGAANDRCAPSWLSVYKDSDVVYINIYPRSYVQFQCVSVLLKTNNLNLKIKTTKSSILFKKIILKFIVQRKISRIKK